MAAMAKAEARAGRETPTRERVANDQPESGSSPVSASGSGGGRAGAVGCPGHRVCRARSGCCMVCALMVRAAAGAGSCARALSFKGSVQLYLAFAQQLCFASGACAKRMTAHPLGGISELLLPIRPGRVEPHAFKRRPKNHQRLTVPREVALEKSRKRSRAGNDSPCPGKIRLKVAPWDPDPFNFTLILFCYAISPRWCGFPLSARA